MENIQTQFNGHIDRLIELVTLYGGKVLLAVIALVVGLWIISKISNLIVFYRIIYFFILYPKRISSTYV